MRRAGRQQREIRSGKDKGRDGNGGNGQEEVMGGGGNENEGSVRNRDRSTGQGRECYMGSQGKNLSSTVCALYSLLYEYSRLYNQLGELCK